MVEYIREKRREAEDWRTTTRAKAECGGAILLGRLLTEHGEKGDLYARIGISRNTAATYVDAYKYFPWAYDGLLKEEQEALSKEEIYSPTLEHVIWVGKKAAEAAGVSRRKPTYSGSGAVLIIDPVSRTVAATEMPAGFPGAKTVKPRWEKQDYELQAGGVPTSGRGRSTILSELYIEVGGNRTGYYEFDVPLRDSSAPPIKLRLKSRALLIRVKKKEVLPPLAAETVKERVNFDAREPKKAPVFEIDPTSGRVVRKDILDNEIAAAPGNFNLTLLDTMPLVGLTVVQRDPNSLFAYTIAERRFRGASYLLRLEGDSRWIAPLAVPLSAADVRQQIVFNTLDAAVKESGEQLPTNPDEAFEELDEHKIRDYFDGLTWHEVLSLVNERLGLGTSGHASYPRKYVEAGLQSPRGRAWHIPTLREVIAKTKAQRTETEARLESEGFVANVTAEQVWGEFSDVQKRRVVMHRLLELPPDATDQDISQATQKAGFRQQIGDKRYTNLSKLKPLIDAEIARIQGKTAPITHEELHPEDYVPPGFEQLDDATLGKHQIPATTMEEFYDLLRSEFGEYADIAELLTHLSLLRMLGADRDQPFWNVLKLRVFIRQIHEQLAPSEIPSKVAMEGCLKFSPTSFDVDLDELQAMVGGAETATNEAERRGLAMTIDGTAYWHPEKTIAFYRANSRPEPLEAAAEPPASNDQLFTFEHARQEPSQPDQPIAQASQPSSPPDNAEKVSETVVDPDYETLSNKARDVADRALRDDITSSLQLAQRETALARRELQSSKPAGAIKPLEIALAALSQVENQVAIMMARLGIAKSERLADVVAAYLNTDQGQMTLYPQPNGIDEILRSYSGEAKPVPPIKILSLVLTTSKGDVTLPPVAEKGDAGRDKVASTRGRRGNRHTTH